MEATSYLLLPHVGSCCCFMLLLESNDPRIHGKTSTNASLDLLKVVGNM